MYAERRGDAQQGQQGQAQQGQGQQGQGQQGQQGQQGAPKPTLPSVSLREFVFTLALGDMQTGAGSTFTPAATKALADLKDFLPYKRYTLLDTIYQIGPNVPNVQMKGIDDGQKYEFLTQGQAPSVPNRTSMRVHLRTVAAPERPATFLIDSVFEIEIGETVVVGTSRLQGDTALIVLLTAVARADRPARGGRMERSRTRRTHFPLTLALSCDDGRFATVTLAPRVVKEVTLAKRRAAKRAAVSAVKRRAVKRRVVKRRVAKKAVKRRALTRRVVKRRVAKKAVARRALKRRAVKRAVVRRAVIARILSEGGMNG
jgi:hypothetical protein